MFRLMFRLMCIESDSAIDFLFKAAAIIILYPLIKHYRYKYPVYPYQNSG